MTAAFALNFADIRAAILRDQQNRQPDLAIGPDSDAFIRASANANAIAGLYDYQAWIVRQIFPDTCDPAQVAQHAAQHNLSPLPATSAVGSITLTGTAGSIQPQGSQARAASPQGSTAPGPLYQLTQAATIPAGGSVTVPASAVLPGVAANNPNNCAATLISAAPGIASAATLSAMQGGTDPEDPEHLRARLLDLLRNPPAGGNPHDYEVWAMDIPGIVSAKAYNLRRGPGTIDLFVTGQSGPPAPATIAQVAAAIAARRPAGLPDLQILAPTVRTIDHTIAIAISSGQLADYTAPINAALSTYIAGIAPGGQYIKSQAESIISSITGITDRQQTTPAANIQAANSAAAVEWLQMGNLTLTAL